jgi:2-hydroxy-3-oxopropionate reductase
MTERIGFIGLGLMGQPMVRNLLRAGFPVIVFNRSQAAITQLVSEGASAATNLGMVAERSDIVITMLPDSPDVEQVVLGQDGVLVHARSGMLLIDMSTIAPSSAQRIATQAAEQGVASLDAPVSGGVEGAIAGSLSIMVGGEASDLERAHPILAAMGRTITHCGGHGAGQVVKACNQVAVALHIAALSEALTLGSKAGVDPAIIVRVLSGGLAQSRVMDLRGQSMAQGDFTPRGKARFHAKDLAIALDLARSNGAVLPHAATTAQLFAALIARGGGDLDHSALLLVLQALAGIEQTT